MLLDRPSSLLLLLLLLLGTQKDCCREAMRRRQTQAAEVLKEGDVVEHYVEGVAGRMSTMKRHAVTVVLASGE